jgi:glycosyl transferase, family 2/glycosyl transferase family 8
MQTEPLISVIVPVYNVAPYLELALDSIRYQSYQNLEIILINDGSTDDSESICKDIASQDERFRYIYQENAGASVARNRGLDLASGEYIIFVDSDDWLDTSAIEILYRNLKKYDADIAAGNYNMYNDSKQEFSFKVFDSDYREQVYADKEIMCQFAKQEMKDMAWACTMMKLYKMDLFAGLRFPLGKNVEDNFIIYKVFLKAKRVVHVEKAIYWYRVGREGTLNNVWTEKRVMNEMEAWNERLALIAMMGHDISGHSYIYYCRLTRALEMMEKVGLQGTETYRRVKETYYIRSREWEK